MATPSQKLTHAHALISDPNFNIIELYPQHKEHYKLSTKGVGQFIFEDDSNQSVAAPAHKWNSR